jgi:hypothetical protein
MKTITARVDVALSKASRATDAEKFLLEEVKNLGKAMKCKSFELLICSVHGWRCVIFFSFCRCMS